MRSFVASALCASALLLSLLLAASPIVAQESPLDAPDGALNVTIWIPAVAAEGRGLNVTPALDPTRAVSKIMTPAGGTITATSADGDTFTLTLPAGALNITTTITMTPVTSIVDSPLGAPTAGVQIAPDMLGLWKTATLRVVSAPAVPVAEQVSFAWFASGRDFHRYPLTLSPTVVEFGVNRLHGFGIGREVPSTAADVSAAATVQTTWTPADALANISHNLQQIIQQMREDALAGRPTDPALHEQVESQMRAAWESAIKPTLVPMTLDCEYAHDYMPIALGWTRDLQLLGYHEQFASEIEQVDDAVVKALENCLAEAAEPCFLFEDVAQTVEILGYMRALQLVGGDETFDINELPQCERIHVALNGQRAKYFPMGADPETGWNAKALYTIEDDGVAGVLQVVPFGRIALFPYEFGWPGAWADVTVQAKIGGEWRTLDTTDRWLCRDKLAERAEAIIVEISNVIYKEGVSAPKTPVQVLASGVGCWRWEVEHTYSSKASANLPQRDILYTLNTTLEFSGTSPSATWDSLQNRIRIGGAFLPFGLIGEGNLTYTELRSSSFCSEELDINKEPPEHFGGNYSKTWNFNIDPAIPNDTDSDIGFVINGEFEGDCPTPGFKEYQFVAPAEEIAENGRSANGSDAGDHGEQSGIYTTSWNYTALRE